MEKEQRNLLYNTVVRCRRLLEEDFSKQLEGSYGVHAGGKIEPLAGLKHLDAIGRAERQAIEAAISHYVAAGTTRREATQRYLRESAFTFLNRLAALKLMEHPGRALVQPSLVNGSKSKGFTQFSLISPEAMRAQPDGGYRLYLELLFDDLGQTLGVLFDRTTPTSILFASQSCLQELLGLLNAAELTEVWGEDETIGWIYQYFTPTELREEARKASSAPRNSYELAFRNQFYTPRYVVEFLTDNTLGRMWYEMCKGRTALAERCRYLIRRPVEIFLNDPQELLFRDCRPWVRQAMAGDFSRLPGDPSEQELASISLAFDGYEVAERLGTYGELLPWAGRQLESYKETGRLPSSSLDLWLIMFALQREWRIITGSGPAGADFLSRWRRVYLAWRAAMQEDSSGLSTEALLRRPVYIPHRPPRDPRTFRILDPACGSGHFLLYAFDLLLTIYQEAWERGWIPPEEFGYRPEAASREEAFAEFLRQVPRLILAHNLHGIDIDRRAAQIAALALWLRAQRAYADLNIRRQDRPHIDQLQIVCAEPMPGEYELLGEFVRDLQPAVLGNMLRDIWDKMKLAGEVGSLLKIEQEIDGIVKDTHRKLLALPEAIQLTLFGPSQPPLPLRRADLDDKAFWAEAGERVVAALRRYAAQATQGAGVTRRLFADDAVQGMALIDLLQRPFDVVLMNPPFGAASSASKPYLNKAYPRTKNDLYAAFVERGLELLQPGGYLGAITSRTGFFLTSFQKWREEILLQEAQLLAMADLGYGVLDTAMVETAAYVLRKQETANG